MDQKQFNRLIDAPITEGTVVLVRIDCNVPLKGIQIDDTFRLEAVTPTLEYLKQKKAKVIIAGAIGRPKGKRDESLTTELIAKYFEDRVFDRCQYVDSAVGVDAQKAIGACSSSNAVMLENLRFYPGEESNDEVFAKELTQGIDVYINDAFGQSHRKQASIVGITNFLPSFSGFCMEKEVDALENVLNTDQHPTVAIIGGAKVSDKLGVIEALVERCDKVLIGGAMAYTFLKATGRSIGQSLCEDDFQEKALALLESGKIVLPDDTLVAESYDSTDTQVCVDIPDDLAGFDIGPATVSKFEQELSGAKMILWNGPMGVFEKDQFAKGTIKIAQVVANSQAFSVVGGGDSVSAIRKFDLQNKIDHVSTGGGATLEYIEDGSLIGVDALITASKKGK